MAKKTWVKPHFRKSSIRKTKSGKTVVVKQSSVKIYRNPK